MREMSESEFKKQVEALSREKTNITCGKCSKPIYIGDWIMLAIEVTKKFITADSMTKDLFSYIHVECPRSRLRLEIK